MTTLEDIRGRATIGVPEAAGLLGISSSQAYTAARAGQIPALTFGRRIVVPVKPLLALLGELEVRNDDH